MLSSYLTGRESPTLKTLEKLLDGLKLRLEDLAGALDDVQRHGRRRPARSAKEDLRPGFPSPGSRKVFMEQFARLGLVPRRKAKKPASPRPKPRKPGKA